MSSLLAPFDEEGELGFGQPDAGLGLAELDVGRPVIDRGQNVAGLDPRPLVDGEREELARRPWRRR